MQTPALLPIRLLRPLPVDKHQFVTLGPESLILESPDAALFLDQKDQEVAGDAPPKLPGAVPPLAALAWALEQQNWTDEEKLAYVLRLWSGEEKKDDNTPWHAWTAENHGVVRHLQQAWRDMDSQQGTAWVALCIMQHRRARI